MKRKAVSRLIAWKEQDHSQPLCISGPKGIGKTYLALDFAKSFFDRNLYINFEDNAELCRYFEKKKKDDDPEAFLRILETYYQIQPELLRHILFLFDELWFCPSAYQLFLRFLTTNQPISILLITSKMDVFLEQECKNLVRVRLYPMDFDEFLSANGAEWYADIIRGHSMTEKKIPDIVHRELMQLFEDYLEVGGMPGAVNEYINFESTENVMEIHRILYQRLLTYLYEMYPEQEAFKMKQILEVLIEQLLKENHKFQYRFIRRGATRGLYSHAIDALEQQGLIYKCRKISDTTVVEESNFELFLLDIGIFHTLIHSRNKSFEVTEKQRKKAIIKNFTVQALARMQYQTYYWESKSQAKVDLIIKKDTQMIPIELQTQEHMYSKSAGIFRSQFDTPYSIRLSAKNFEIMEELRYYPYYSAYYI